MSDFLRKAWPWLLGVTSIGVSLSLLVWGGFLGAKGTDDTTTAPTTKETLPNLTYQPKPGKPEPTIANREQFLSALMPLITTPDLNESKIWNIANDKCRSRWRGLPPEQMKETAKGAFYDQKGKAEDHVKIIDAIANLQECKP